MTETEGRTGLRGWFAGLPGPGKVLVLLVAVCVLAAAVVLLVTRQPSGPSEAGTAPAPSVSAPSATSSATVGDVEATSTAPSTASTSGVGGTADGVTSRSGSSLESTEDAERGAEDAASSDGRAQTDDVSDGRAGADDGGKGSAASGATATLTEKVRKAIALELIAAEKRAVREAQAKYPTDPAKGGDQDNYDEFIEYRDLLDAQYKAAIVKKFGISTDQLIGIIVVDVPRYE